MPKLSMNDHNFLSVYFSPRGSQRMVAMGMQIAQRHLNPFDRLIGVVGDAGSGKSILIRGMFPGLELTNDDDGVNVRPLPLLNVDEEGFFTSHTYHMDVRFESAFTQMHVLAEATRRALDKGKRVIIEHFELLYPFLEHNAQLLIGVGENILVVRPTIFGPEPQYVADIAFATIRYRRMAHTAEDLSERYLHDRYPDGYTHEDIRHGFMLAFDKQPDIDLKEMESWVKARIARDLPVSYVDDNHIKFGEKLHHCTGPRMHVRHTGEIENFRLLQRIEYDPMLEKYLIVGLVGSDIRSERDLNHLDYSGV